MSEKNYDIKRCKSCQREFILLVKDINSALLENKFIACPYCGSKRIANVGQYDSIKECMNERKYKRNSHGAIIQKS